MSYLLAVDIGNSNVTFALHNGDSWVVNYRISTDPNREADEYAALLIPLISDFGIKLSEVRTVALGSVVAPATKHFSFFVSRYLEAELIVADYKELPEDVLKLDVLQPASVGVDRWLNILAAKSFYFESGKPLVVIDCGTAITLDVLSGDGAFIGGAIAPGLGILESAFKSQIPLLPKPSFVQKSNVIGKGTQQALEAGLRCSFFGTISQMIKEVTEELGEVPTIVGTGGTINILENLKDTFQIGSAFLTLEGLRLFATIKQKNAMPTA